MSSILLYIEPDNSERSQLVQMAADLVEALTFDAEAAFSQEHTIGIVAEPSICLEIGLSMLGRGETRTVEGGERRKSPITIYPYVTDSKRKEVEFSLLGRNTLSDGEMNKESGFLNDLYEFGAIEREMDFTYMERHELNAHSILKRMLHLENMQWDGIFIFGSSTHDSGHEFPWKHFNCKVERITSYFHDEERIHTLLEKLEHFSKDDAVYKAQFEAVTNALQLEELLNHFEAKEQTMGRFF